MLHACFGISGMAPLRLTVVKGQIESLPSNHCRLICRTAHMSDYLLGFAAVADASCTSAIGFNAAYTCVQLYGETRTLAAPASMNSVSNSFSTLAVNPIIGLCWF